MNKMDIVDTNASLTQGAGIPAVHEAETDDDLPHSVKRVKVFNRINREVPVNEYDLPEYIFRADLVPSEFDALDEKEQSEVLRAAAIELSYREGYPTLYDGRTFWSRMPFEPADYYDAFEAYLNMASARGVRSLEYLTGEPGVNLSMNRLSEAFSYYYWAPRCRAFDMFRIAAYQKEREARIMSTNNRHFLEAEKLITQLMGYFSEQNDEGNPRWLEDLTPGVAIQGLEKLAKLQRVALDLPAHGSSSPPENGLPGNASMEVILRTLVQKAQGELSSAGKNTRALDESLLLENPEAAALAQELVIKVNKGANVNGS